MCHVLCMESVQSWVDFLIVLFMDCVQILVNFPIVLGRCPILSRGTKIARGLVRYTKYQHKSMSIKSISLLKPGATRCHGTRIARGVPLPVYINLDLYSGFWCTSRCVVFKYSVPPLTDQVLWRVLLTS